MIEFRKFLNGIEFIPSAVTTMSLSLSLMYSHTLTHTQDNTHPLWLFGTVVWGTRVPDTDISPETPASPVTESRPTGNYVAFHILEGPFISAILAAAEMRCCDCLSRVESSSLWGDTAFRLVLRSHNYKYPLACPVGVCVCVHISPRPWTFSVPALISSPKGPSTSNHPFFCELGKLDIPYTHKVRGKMDPSQSKQTR